MDSERWKQLDNLLQAALERPPAERAEFLRRACAGDEALEREVRSLVASEKAAGGFLLSPAIEVAARAAADRQDSGTASSFTGQTFSHQTLAGDLEKRFGEDTGTRFSYLPVLRAQLSMNDGNPVKAIEQLQIAVPYELGWPRSAIHGSFGAFYPTHVRGEAYLVAHQGAQAAAEFQKILDHRGIVVSDPIGALAHLQLGRALAMSGDNTKAKTAYQDFLTLWKEADSDIPILKQAKTEYAKLQ
jgi:hypothetical protein